MARTRSSGNRCTAITHSLNRAYRSAKRRTAYNHHSRTILGTSRRNTCSSLFCCLDAPQKNCNRYSPKLGQRCVTSGSSTSRSSPCISAFALSILTFTSSISASAQRIRVSHKQQKGPRKRGPFLILERCLALQQAQHTLLRSIRLRQHRCCRLAHDLRLGQLTSHFSKVCIFDA